MPGSSARAKVTRFRDGSALGGRASLAVEEPLEIRVDGQVLATTMRTPGADFDLALGFALTDGAVEHGQVAHMRYCGPGTGGSPPSLAAADLAGPHQGGFNVVDLATRTGAGPRVRRHRHTTVSSACGICGADVVTDLRERAGTVHADRVQVDVEVVTAIPERAHREQDGFQATGGMHAAALFSPDGTLQVLREDVGRHNAVDKIVGWAATHASLPLPATVLFTSGRIAFEIVAKAALAGIPVIVAVSAPTTLAVQVADEVGMTLIGFTREDTFTIYTHPDRVG